MVKTWIISQVDHKMAIFFSLIVVSFFFHGTSLASYQCGSQAGDVVCANDLCCSQYGFCGTTDAYCGDGCQSQCSSSTSTSTPTSSCGSLNDIVSADLFDSLFPTRNSFYTYDAFINAATSFPSFASSSDCSTQKREVAAFFGEISHETSGLYYINEIDTSIYCQASSEYPCATGQEYYGRGPLQITWNFNYGPAGDAIGQDLLDNPSLVAQDPTISFETALWFWTTAQSPKPSCHDVMIDAWTPTSTDTSLGRGPGYGMTIIIINGGECNGGNPSSVADRVSRYEAFCNSFGVDPGEYVSCSNTVPY